MVKTQCKVKGCFNLRFARGLCGSHWSYWLKNDNPWCQPLTVEQELLSRRQLDKGHWLWPGRRDKDGYGTIWLDGKPQRVHRVAYELFVGPIPPGKSVLHRCDVPPCYLPSHLFIGTSAENTADKVKKARQARGEQVGTSRLTEADVIAIRRRYAQGEDSYQGIATDYGVTNTAIGLIVRGVNWRHVPMPTHR